MRLKRDIVALCLLLTFVVGSQLAPLSHYVFMAVSDAYAPHEETAGHELETNHASSSSHHGSSHDLEDAEAVTEPRLPIEGPAFSSVHDHLLCDYADLFATFAATDIEVTERILDLTFLSISFEINEIIVADAQTLHHSRAPPLV